MIKLNEIISEENILKAVDLLSLWRESQKIELDEYYILIKPIEMALNHYIEQDNYFYCKHGGELV